MAGSGISSVAQRADLHDRAARAHQVERLAQRRARSGGLEHHVEAVVGVLGGAAGEQGVGGSSASSAPRRRACARRSGADVARHDQAGAEGPGGHRDQQADGPAAGHEHAARVEGSGPAHGVQGHGERLDQRADPVVQGVRQGVALVGPDGEELGEGAVRGRLRARAAQHDGAAAEVPPAAAAVGAAVAGPRRVDRDAGAHGQARRVVGHRRDHRRQLVAQDERPGGDEGGAVAVPEVVQVGAAHADPAHAQQRHPREKLGPGKGLDADVSSAVQDGGGHGGGHRGPRGRSSP